MFTFVIFHAELEKRAGPAKAVEAPGDYNELTRIAFRSASLFHPGCRKVLLTDTETAFHLDSDVEIIRSEIDPSALMLSRMRCQVEFLEKQTPESHVIFLDSDIVLNGSLQELFDNDFEVGLTYMRSQNTEESAGKMPINGGLFFFKGSEKASALAFMRAVYSRYLEETTEGYEHWWGDQNALMAFIGRERFFQRDSDSFSVEGIQIMLFPKEEYNFSPRNRMRSIWFRLKKEKVLHFRGPRKRLMEPYWNIYLAPVEKPGIKQHLFAWGERVKLLAGILREALSR